MAERLNRSQAPEVKGFGELVIPQVRRVELDNGVPVTIYDSPESLDVNRVSLLWDGGICESPNASIASLTADMLREGSMQHSGAEIAEKLEYNGSWLKSSVSSHHSAMVMYSLNSKIDEVFPLLNEIVTAPSFPERQTAVLREKMVARARVDMEKVEYHSAIANRQLVFGENHPLSRSLTPEELAVISVDDLREHHARVYVPSGLQIYLSGRISPSIEDKLNDVFGCVAVDKPAQGLNIIPFEQSLGKSRIIQRHGALQSALKISIPTINRDDEDYLDLRLAVAALGGYFGSRLMTNIREDKGYTYGISAALMGYREGACAHISTQCDNKYVYPLIDEIKKEIELLQSGGVSDEELARLQNYIMTCLVATLDSPFSIMEYYETLRAIGVGPDYFESQLQSVKNITSERIAQMATRYLDIESMYISIAGNI